MNTPIKMGCISGKGGTGKTTISLSIAVSLAKKGCSVGLLDIDLTGPNITDVFGMQELEIDQNQFIPAISDQNQIKYVSLGQIASEGDPVLWSGKYLKSAAQQLFGRTNWGNLDYLVVDFPPGSGSEPQALLPMMDYVVIVTVPSVLAQSNVQRIIEMCRELQTPIIGVVKNMAYFRCDVCASIHNIFPEDHDFESLGIPTIATIPLAPKFAKEKFVNPFPIDAVLTAMDTPIILQHRQKSLRRRLFEKWLQLNPRRS